MPPKRQQESDSESEGGMDFGGMMGGGLGNMDPDYDKKFLAKLPEKVRDRVTVLQVMDKKVEAENAEHDKKVMELKKKYAKLAAPIFAKRAAVVAGAEEPKEEDIQKGFPEEHKGEVSLTEGSAEGAKEKGLPGFWHRVLTHHVIIDEMISERDGECMEAALTNITYAYLDEPDKGFTLTFHFDAEKNPNFTEASLSKAFYLKEVNDELALEKAVGSKITWKEGKRLDVNTVSKKQKNKKGQVRYTTKEEPCPTFFDFFKTECDEEENEQYHAMAETIKDKMIPYAVEYYTGEADDGQDDMEGGDFDDEDEEEEDDDEPVQMSPAQMQQLMRGRGGGAGAGGRGRGAGGQQECNQQ